MPVVSAKEHGEVAQQGGGKRGVQIKKLNVR